MTSQCTSKGEDATTALMFDDYTLPDLEHWDADLFCWVVDPVLTNIYMFY